MCAGEHVHEESFGRLEPSPLGADPFEVILDHGRPSLLGSVQDLLDLTKRQAGVLACLHHTQAVHVLLGVPALPRGCPFRHHDADLVPVPKHVHLDTEPVGDLSDPHQSSIAR